MAEPAETTINDLPDELLRRIISRLPTKYAAVTSFLSTRWNNLFLSLPNLDFDDSLLFHFRPRILHDLDNDRIIEEFIEDNDAFIKFVFRFLKLRNNSPIHIFKLKLSRFYDPIHVNQWIAAAFATGVREFDLYMYQTTPVGLYPNLFHFETLEVLKLHLFFHADFPKTTCFPNLKLLRLCWHCCFDHETAENIVAGSPVLEEFVMHGIHVSLSELHLHIRSSSLKRLTLNLHLKAFKQEDYYNHYNHYSSVAGGDFIVVVDAPNLEYINLLDDGQGPITYQLNNLSSVIEAYIQVDYRSSFRAILAEILNVEYLTLSPDPSLFLVHGRGPLPMLHKLTHLKVSGEHHLERFLNALEFCPNLEVLEFYKTNWTNSHPPQCEPKYFPPNLEAVSIRDFKGQENEMDTVKYFLKNAVFLKKMTLVFDGMYRGEKSDIFNELLISPSGSSICQITFA